MSTIVDTLGLLSLRLLSDKKPSKDRKVVEDHSMSIPTKFGFNWQISFGEEDHNVTSLQTMTDSKSFWFKFHCQSANLATSPTPMACEIY